MGFRARVAHLVQAATSPPVPAARTLEPAGRERRAPQVGTKTVAYSVPGYPTLPTWDGMSAIRGGYYASTYVHRAIRILALDIAKLAFRAGGSAPENLWDQPDHDESALLARFLGPPPRGPNPTTSARSLWAWTVAQYLLCGKFAWEAELTTGRGPLANRDILALWPLPAQHLYPIPSRGASSDYWLKYRYMPQGDPIDLPTERVIYCWRPKQDDWRQPESVLEAVQYPLAVSTMIDRYNYAFLKNNGVPAHMVIYPTFAEEDEERAFRAQFNSEYGGVNNAGKIAFGSYEADEGEGAKSPFDIKQIGLSQADAKLLETRDKMDSDLSIAFGVPRSKLGDAADRTYSNADQEDKNYQLDTLVPLALELQDHINLTLAPRLGPEIGWFDLSQLSAVRDMGNLLNPPAPAVEQVTVNAPDVDPAPQLALAASAPQSEERAPDTVEAGGAATPHSPELPVLVERGAFGAPTSLSGQHAAPPLTEDRQAPEVDHEARRALIWRRVDAQARTLETLWERQMRAHFAEQEQAVLARLEGKRGRQALRDTRAPDPGGIFDLRHWVARLTDLARGLLETVFTVGAGRVAEKFGDVGIGFDVASPYAQQFILQRANQLAGQVSTTTYTAIQQAMADGVAAGEGIPEIAARVRAVFAQASGNRAEMIARTEVLSGINSSAALAADQLPPDVVAGREWVATPDHRTRDDHRDADGQVRGRGLPFTVGGVLMMHPGQAGAPAEQVIRCRCTLAFLGPEEMTTRARQSERRWTLDQAARVLDLVAAELIGPGDVSRALEVTAA